MGDMVSCGPHGERLMVAVTPPMCVMYRSYCLQVWDKDVVTDDDVIGRTSWSFCPQKVGLTNKATPESC